MSCLGVVLSTATGVPSTLAEQGTPSMPIEFASPPSDITEFVDAFHEGEEVGSAGWMTSSAAQGP